MSGETDMLDRLDRPCDLELYVMRTGSVHMSGNIHFNKKDPRFGSMPKDGRFNPVLAFLLEHPGKGRVLLDTGLDPCFCESRFGNFGPLLGRVVKTKTEKGADVVSQLASLGVAPAEVPTVMMSHLHLDHASCLGRFGGSTVYVDAAELAAARSPLGFAGGYLKAPLDGRDIRTFDYTGRLGPFPRACDFFGDGSVFVLDAAGHTRGNVAVLLNARGGPILLTFDAAHRRANVEEGMPPKGDYERAKVSIDRIRELLDLLPGARVIFGHDPDQLPELKLAPESYS